MFFSNKLIILTHSNVNIMKYGLRIISICFIRFQLFRCKVDFNFDTSMLACIKNVKVSNLCYIWDVSVKCYLKWMVIYLDIDKTNYLLATLMLLRIKNRTIQHFNWC